MKSEYGNMLRKCSLNNLVPCVPVGLRQPIGIFKSKIKTNDIYKHSYCDMRSMWDKDEGIRARMTQIKFFVNGHDLRVLEVIEA